MSNNKDKSFMRHLKQNSKNGNLFSTYQLFEFYSNDKNILSSSEKKEKYFQKCKAFIEALIEKPLIAGLSPKNRFVLDTLKLIDIKKFHSLNIEFEDDLTVIIGENGLGKTTILQCIAKTLSWITSNLIKENGNGSLLNYNDIKNDAKDNGEILTKFKYGNQYVNASLARSVKGVAKKKDSSVMNLKSIASIWRVVNSQNQINLPLFINYSVNRFCQKLKPASSTLLDLENRFDVYDDCLKDEKALGHFGEWFIRLNKKGKKINLNSYYQKELKQRIKQLLPQENIEIDESILLNLILEQSSQINNLKSDDDENYKKIEILKQAIKQCMPEINDIYVDISSGRDEIFIQLGNEKLNINQLSDGQKIFLGIVADLTYRLLILNPKLENPLNGQGIVLIDEIELHLHPKWQQDILINLTKTFPNIQFVVTTHSPQVLSTVYKRQIRQILETDENVFITRRPEFQTRGVMSSDVLEQIMNTKSVPDIAEVKKLHEFYQYIQENKFNTSEAENLFSELTKHFGSDHPEILKCKNLIEFKKFIVKKNNH
ncbi:hypothetical protein BHC43_09795 [Snodgrassella alvi]|uniref:retron Ec78 anti-phage system effector ATPase PtuA n=1 Tax=Snodgrassella alvi TaxID=1196083 RepID=UPI000C1F42D7|nr:retron Ec78 anti-phage system effector ATPase PtuA [Snodgrassella alvi]PIT36401.1 hypothetical protein BHC43_09795 [Snodgrassella alvi]